MICQESDDAICGDPGGWEAPCVDPRLERDPNLRELFEVESDPELVELESESFGSHELDG